MTTASLSRLRVVGLATVVLLASVSAVTPTAMAKKAAIAGVSLGDSPKRVRQVLGKPLRVVRSGPACPAYSFDYVYPDRLRVSFFNLSKSGCEWSATKVVFVETKSPKDKFSDGTHVGERISASEYERRRPDADCTSVSLGDYWRCEERLSEHGKYVKLLTTHIKASPSHKGDPDARGRIYDVWLQKVCDNGTYALNRSCTSRRR